MSPEPAHDPCGGVSAAWLGSLLQVAGRLPRGQVSQVACRPDPAFNSRLCWLELRYSGDLAGAPPVRLVLKRNLAVEWARAAGADEVRFYQLAAALDPAPPAIIPCAAAVIEPGGDSCLLLHDLSETHAPPVSRDELVSVAASVPAQPALEQAIDALARHHAFWWDHELLHGGQFEVGFWTRDAGRLQLYLARRRAGWELLLAGEGDRLPHDIRALYEAALAGIERHWARLLEPRFSERRQLTLVHGDAYFSNILCPRAGGGSAYLLDWQSPSVDLGGYDLANMLATFWTSEQRAAGSRELGALRRYHATLLAAGVRDYAWDDLARDYQTGLIFWLLMPVQDRFDGAPRDYWWPKMQCLAAAFREWSCLELMR
jgi:hypothetical protein